MDYTTAVLIVELQLREIDQLRELEKGMQLEGTLTDQQHALLAYEDNILRNRVILNDGRMAASMIRAIYADTAILDEIRNEENHAALDRQMACDIGGVANITVASLQDRAFANALDDETMQNLSLLNIRDVSEDKHHTENHDFDSSSSSTVDNDALAITKATCISCFGERYTSDITVVPCNHTYCRECILALFEAAMKDETLYPPRCCREVIPPASVSNFLPFDFLQEFKAKAIEFDTPNRTYCAQATCSAFIPSECISADVASCPSCQLKTCIFCKGTEHLGECSKDPNFQSLLGLALQNEWMTCYSCSRMIELSTGCHHITYAPSHQF